MIMGIEITHFQLFFSNTTNINRKWMKLEVMTDKNYVEYLLLRHIAIHQKYLDQTSENRKKYMARNYT